jgi:hypothetical protein
MINEDHYDSETTTVYVLKAEPQHDIIDFLSLNGHDFWTPLPPAARRWAPTTPISRGR